ncbi:MAG: T9SS type A sorting domain-containing protein [Chitinophagales bacterium]
MKKFLQTALCLVALCLTTSSAFAQCTDFTDGPYTDLNPIPCAETCGTPVEAGFQVYSNEAYVLENTVAGGIYTIDICNGYGAWAAEITVVDYTGGVAGATITSGTGCTLTFTTPADGDVLVIFTEVGNCAGAQMLDNGLLTLDMDCTTAAPCPASTCNAGDVAGLDAQVVCLDGAITLNTDGMEDLSLSVNPSYGWGFYSAVDNSLVSFVTFGADPANYNLTDVPYNALLEFNELATIPAGDYFIYGIIADDKNTTDTADDEFCFTTNVEFVTFLDANDPACFCMPGDINGLVLASPQTIEPCDAVNLFTDGTQDMSGNVNGMYYWNWYDATTLGLVYQMSTPNAMDPGADLNTCDIPAGEYEVHGVVIDDRNTPEDTTDDVACLTPNFAVVTVTEPAAMCGPLMTNQLTSTFGAGLNVTLSWEAVADAQAYQLAGRKQGGTTKVFPETQNLSRTFTSGIQPNTTYQWSVRVLCDGVWTDYALDAGPATFSTGAGKNISGFDAFATETLTATVYPNPATNVATISLNTAWDNNSNITVVDMLGKVVAQYTNVSNELALDVTNFSNGYYFVQAENGQAVTTTKFVVAK